MAAKKSSVRLSIRPVNKKQSVLRSNFTFGKKKFPMVVVLFFIFGVMAGGYFLLKSRAATSDNCITCSLLTNQPSEGPVTIDGETYDAKVEFEDFSTNVQAGFLVNGDPCYQKYQSTYSGDRFSQPSDGGWNVWIRKYDIARTPLSQMQAKFEASEIPDASQYVDLTDYQKAKGNASLYQAYQLSKYLSPYYGRNAYRIMSINQNPYIEPNTPAELTGNSSKLGDACRVAAKYQSAVALVKVTNTGTATWGIGPGEGIDGNGDIVNLNDPSKKRPNPTLQTTIDGSKAIQLFGGASAPVTTTSVKPGESVELTFTFYDNGKFKSGGQTIGVSQPGLYQIPIQMVLPGKAWFGNRVDIGFKAVDDLINSQWANQEVGPYSSNPTGTTSGTTTQKLDLSSIQSSYAGGTNLAKVVQDFIKTKASGITATVSNSVKTVNVTQTNNVSSEIFPSGDYVVTVKNSSGQELGKKTVKVRTTVPANPLGGN